MLKIRFNRIGRRNRPYYRIVVQEHTAAPGGRHVAIVGSYDPHAKKTIIKEEAVKHWLSVGAQASDTVHNLLIKHGVIYGKKRSKGKNTSLVNEKDVEESKNGVNKSLNGEEKNGEENKPSKEMKEETEKKDAALNSEDKKEEKEEKIKELKTEKKETKEKK